MELVCVSMCAFEREKFTRHVDLEVKLGKKEKELKSFKLCHRCYHCQSALEQILYLESATKVPNCFYLCRRETKPPWFDVGNKRIDVQVTERDNGNVDERFPSKLHQVSEFL